MSTTAADGMTVSLAMTGITKICESMIASQIVKEVSSLDVGTVTVPLAKFDYCVSSWADEWMYITNLSVNLDSGTLSNFDPVYQSVSQDTSGLGQFTFAVNAGNFSVNFTEWYETYTQQLYVKNAPNPAQNEATNCGAYAMSLGLDMTAVTTVTYQATGNTWNIDVSSTTATPQNPSAGIPSNSVLQNAETGWCSSENVIQTQAEQAVETSIDWQTLMTSALNGVAATIPASGNLGSNIVLGFAQGATGLTYTNGSTGLQVGVTALASYDGSDFPGTPPTTLALPAIPTATDAVFNVSDYAFNGIFWAFYSAGMINYTFTPSNLPDPSALQTATYQGTTLGILYDVYGATTMEALIAATAAPSVAFETVWQVTSASVASMESGGVPATVAQDLLGALAGSVYTSVGSFNQAVTGAIGANNCNLYFNTISTACGELAAVCTLPMSVDIQVWNTSAQPQAYADAFKFTVSLTFFLVDLCIAKASSGTTQSLCYSAEVISSTAPVLVSSAFAQINSGDIGQVWLPTLRQAVMSEIQAFGNLGVPLPRISGCSFPGGEQIAINPGYVVVATNFTFG